MEQTMERESGCRSPDGAKLNPGLAARVSQSEGVGASYRNVGATLVVALLANVAQTRATTRVTPIGANISAFTYKLTLSVSLPGLTGQSSNPCRLVVTGSPGQAGR